MKVETEDDLRKVLEKNKDTLGSQFIKINVSNRTSKLVAGMN